VVATAAVMVRAGAELRPTWTAGETTSSNNLTEVEAQLQMISSRCVCMSARLMCPYVVCVPLSCCRIPTHSGAVNVADLLLVLGNHNKNKSKNRKQKPKQNQNQKQKPNKSRGEAECHH
jgi:hypothetical protein